MAVTMMSASSSRPDVRRMPVGVTESMVSVMTSTRPARIASYRSPSGIRHRRWSHGLYRGVKWVSTSTSGSALRVSPTSLAFHFSGFD